MMKNPFRLKYSDTVAFLSDFETGNLYPSSIAHKLAVDENLCLHIFSSTANLCQ